MLRRELGPSQRPYYRLAFLAAGGDARQRFFAEAGQTLPMLSTAPDSRDLIEAMKMQRLRLAKDQGLRPWTPQAGVRIGHINAT